MDARTETLSIPRADADAFIAHLRDSCAREARAELESRRPRDARAAAAQHAQATAELVAQARRMMSEDFRAFARQAVRRIAEDLRDCGADALERRARELLYRAFDPLDEVFELRYELDTGMKAADSRERHFEGTGLGVQTSYASILKLLPKLGLGAGARLIDLGSGYGRVGLMTGLWREDLQFTGYELVAHRVRSANASAVRAGLAPRVEFIAQDLAARDFLIPAAEAYYLYDPFCAETYRHVLGQLARFGRERAITVITKADARRWFLDFVADAGWSEPEPCDENTLWLFRSRPVLVASGVLSV